jgi:hypothetical protein
MNVFEIILDVLSIGVAIDCNFFATQKGFPDDNTAPALICQKPSYLVI